MKKVSCFLSLALIVGCASKHVGVEGSAVSGYRNLKITAEQVAELSDDTNHFYSLTIENTGSEWLRVDEAELDFANPQDISHRLVVGKDLQAWFLSNEEKQALNAQNNRMLLEGLNWASIGVLAVGVISKDKTASLGGLAGMGAVGGYKKVQEVLKDKRNTETAKQVPETHIYSPFTVPSSGFTRKWFLIHTPKNALGESAILKFKTVEGVESVYKIRLQKAKQGQKI